MSSVNTGSKSNINVTIGGGQVLFSEKMGVKETGFQEIPQELRDMEIAVGEFVIKNSERIDKKTGKKLGKVSKERYEKLKKERKVAGMDR